MAPTKPAQIHFNLRANLPQGLQLYSSVPGMTALELPEPGYIALPPAGHPWHRDRQSREDRAFCPHYSSGSLAAKIFPLEFLEVFFSEHSAFSLLFLLLCLGHYPVTSFAALALLQNLERFWSKSKGLPFLEAQVDTLQITWLRAGLDQLHIVFRAETDPHRSSKQPWLSSQVPSYSLHPQTNLLGHRLWHGASHAGHKLQVCFEVVLTLSFLVLSCGWQAGYVISDSSYYRSLLGPCPCHRPHCLFPNYFNSLGSFQPNLLGLLKVPAYRMAFS